MKEATNSIEFQFLNEQYLYLIFAISIPILIFILAQIIRNRRLAKFGDLEIIKQLMPDASKTRIIIKFTFTIIALILIIIAIARPRTQLSKEEATVESSEIIIALDVSTSMAANDIKPNRLEKAKSAIRTLLQKTNYKNRMGLIVFAGEAYTQLPITSDYDAADMFLSAVSIDMVESKGTNLRAAIELAGNSFGPDQDAGRAIIIITDGEDHEEQAIEAAKEVAEKDIKIYTVGMGKNSPVPFIDPSTGKYKLKKNGKHAKSKINESILTDIATAGNGEYTQGNYINSAMNEVAENLSKLKKSKLKKDGDNAKEWFEYPTAIALIILILEFILLERKNKYLKNINLFD